MYYGGYYTGSNAVASGSGSRDDLTFQAGWQLSSGGLGDYYRIKEARSRYNQANIDVTRLQAQVSAEVVTAVRRVQALERALKSAQEAVSQSEEMWRRLSKAAFGFAGPARQYDPLEALVAIQQLYTNRIQYLEQVINFNREQFRLYWAMGKPPQTALPDARPLPLKTPVLPDSKADAKGP